MNKNIYYAIIFLLCAEQFPIQSMEHRFPNFTQHIKDLELYGAIVSCNPTRIQTALLQGADINAGACEYENQTPLHVAVQTRQVEIVQLLLTTPGININKKCLFQETPLHTAVSDQCDSDIIESLIDAGAEVNTQDQNQRTALDDAARLNNLVAVQLFLTKSLISHEVVQDALLKLQDDVINPPTTNFHDESKQCIRQEITALLENFLHPHDEYLLK